MMQHLLIIWKDINNTGIPIIDEQHRGIVSTINSLYYIVTSDHSHKLLDATIQTVEEYTKIHFTTEEYLMKKSSYPAIHSHIKLHEELAANTFTVSRESKQFDDPMVFLNFLKDWWREHINQRDKEYSAHLKKYFNL